MLSYERADIVLYMEAGTQVGVGVVRRPCRKHDVQKPSWKQRNAMRKKSGPKTQMNAGKRAIRRCDGVTIRRPQDPKPR